MARLTRWLSGGAGLTLVEIVIALGILTIGLTALLSALQFAFSGIHASGQASTAVFLAVQRLEEIKAFALSSELAKGLANVTSATFPAEPYATIVGYGSYRRHVTIIDPPAVPANAKGIQVTVFYRPITEGDLAAHETAVSVSTLIASR